MIKTTFLFRVTILFLILLNFESYAQNLKAFTPRFDQDLNGNMLLIGNNILSQHVSNNYNNNAEYNSNIDMKYVDIDGDATTFSSSSATLSIPNPGCAKVRYAGLYWGALLQSGIRTDINKVKFKTPAAGYADITGSVIWDATAAELGGNRPYACYADVTALVSAGASGNYTVANVLSSLGKNGGTGLSAGWSLVVIYEDPTLPARSITTFDGFSGISTASGNLNIPVSGFRTIPSGPVRAQYAFSALEGDKPISGDFIMINGTKVTPPSRPLVGGKDNFFNSTVTNQGGVILARTPASTNTLGFDAGILDVPNPSTVAFPGGSVIKNADVSATMTMGTTQDTYFLYFNAFAVEIIEPNIVITKVVQDALGNDASNANVTLGQILFYEIEYQNKGNDDAVGFTIKDILPLNTIFNTADLDLTNSGGATYTYDATTRTILFTIPDSAVQEKDPSFKIRFKVQVVPTCNELNNACSNIIKNQAFGNYKGRYSGNTINQDPSIPSASPCLFAVPSPTNFLVGLDGCVYTRNEILCGTTTTLNAAAGYTTYSWSKNADGSNPFAFTQSITVNAVGTYYVRDTAAAPCLSITEIIIVSLFGGTVTNPVLPFGDQIVTCPSDGKKLPLIFLCGANATKLIKSGISDGSTIIWDKLNENGSCPAATSTTVCANESNSCTWTQVGTGQDFLVNAAGQYRMTLNYPGNCFNRFYFTVFQNVLNPTATVIDKVCLTNGQITVGGVPPGYEYSLDGATYQDSNVFAIATGGIYTAFIKQKGVTTNPCIFTVPNIFVRERDFTVDTFVTPPLCNGGKGSIKFAANDVLPQYFYKISQGGTLVNNVGPILASDYTFANLLAGTYQAEVSTSDGCNSQFNVVIPDTPLLQATAAITIPLTCNNGEVTVTPTGGTAPYFYFVNSTTAFVGDPKIIITTAGVYKIDVVDANNCTATTSITVAQTPAPTFVVTPTNVLCAGTNTGTITFGSIVTNGNTLRYAIDVTPGTPAIPGTPDTAEIPATPPTGTFLSSPVFTGLAPGTYTVAVEYTIAGQVCYSNLQTVTINNTTPIVFGTNITADYTCTTLGEITVTPWPITGGTPPYETSIDGVAFVPAKPTYSGLVDGTYVITVRDANGCIATSPNIVFVPMSAPIINSITAPPLSCINPTATVTVNATGGLFNPGALPPLTPQPVMRYNYLDSSNVWSAYQTSNIFTGLAPGTYFFRATDGKNCYDTKAFTIAPLPALTVIGQLVSNVKCFNTSTGATKFTVSNFGVGGFTYTINDGTTTSASIAGPVSGIIDLINQPAGTYTIIVTDVTTTCTATTLVTVANAPTALSATIAVSPIKCSGVNGSVTITASGGWGGYSYTLTQPDLTVLGPQGSATFANLAQTGNYTVTTTDANGCAVSNTFALSTPASPTASIDPLSDLCFDGVNAATLVVSATGGVGRTLEYNINGGSFQASNTFANLTPGVYTIIVRDDYGCSVTVPAVTIAPQLIASTVLTKDTDCSASVNGTITGTISGGYPDYKYRVSVNGAAFAGVYTNLGVGVTTFPFTVAPVVAVTTFQFEITDAKGCVSLTGVITINPLVSPTATLTIVKPSCFGGTNGSVQIIPAGGVGPYTYIFNGSAVSAISLYTGLNGTTNYSYQVFDSKNCSFSGTVTLGDPTQLIATATATAFTCDATNTKQAAVVTIAVPTTGTAPYQYSFNGSATYTNSNTLTVNDTGVNQNILFSVKDANGCTAGGTVVITKFNPPTDITFAQARPITCVDLNSDITLTMPVANGGVAPFVFENSTSGTTNGTGVFTNLIPGTYVFKVTDFNGCYFTKSYIVTPVTPIAISGVKLSDVLCKGGTTGSIQYTVSGYAGNYTPLLTAGAGTLTPSTSTAVNTLNLTGLIGSPAGISYTVKVTDDATGCFASSTILITEPANGLSITAATATNTNCNNDKAQITVTAAGGTLNYGYAAVKNLDPAPVVFAASNIITVDTTLGGMVWDVYVKDVNGCPVKTTVTVVKDAAPTITSPLSQCFVGTPITINIIGTTFDALATATYSIGGGFQASNSFTINAAGTYPLIIKDKNGCTATVNYTVYPQLTATLTIKELDCTGTPDATVTITAAGGDLAWTYEVATALAGPYTTTGLVGNVFTTATPGTFFFKVTDGKGCSVINSTTISPISYPTATLTQIKPSCFGGTDGSVQIVPSGGVGPYTYSFTGLPQIVSSPSLFTGLNGTTNYAYQVLDSKNCAFNGTVTLGEPTALAATAAVIPFKCSATNTKVSGSLTVTAPVGTGTAPYQYSFNGSAYGSINSLTVNDTGVPQTISYNVKDANGCTLLVPGSITFSELIPPTGFTINATPIYCLPVASQTSTATISAVLGGVGIFQYETIAPSPIIFGQQVSNVFSGLTPGTYIFKVTDANGCYFTKSHIVPPVVNIAVTALKLNDVDCNPGNNGAIQYTVSGFGGTYSYSINGGAIITGQSALTINLINQIAGVYKIDVTDEVTGCTSTATITITEPASGISITSAIATNVHCNNDNSQITVTATGGTPNYTYGVVKNGSGGFPVYGPSAVLNVDTNSGVDTAWDVYVRDQKGCETFQTVNVLLDLPPTIGVLPATPPCFTGATIPITISGLTVGTPTYSIGFGYQAIGNFSITTAGNYTLSIKDGNGCISSIPYNVLPKLTLSAVLDKDITCTLPAAAQITLTASGGNGTYAYEYSTDAGVTYTVMATNVLNAATAGSYTFRVTSNLCTDVTTAAIIVNPAPAPIATVTAVNPTCNGSTDGSIKLVGSGGEAPYTYSIDNGATFVTTNVFGGLSTGGFATKIFDYIVRDNKGCDATGTVTLSDPVAITAIIVKNPVTCGIPPAGITFGSIDISTSGGVAPFTYTLYDNTFTQIGLPVTTLSTTNIFSGLDFGDYYVTIVDAKGCDYKSPIERITTVPFLTLQSVVDGGTCAVGATVTISVNTVIGGVAPFTYSIVGQVAPALPVQPTMATSYSFPGLTYETTYFFQVKDFNGCISVLQVDIPKFFATITVAATTTTNVSCNGDSTGSVNFTVSTFDLSVTDINYELLNPLTNLAFIPAISGTISGLAGGPVSGTILGLKAGDYLLKVKEATGTVCSASTSFSITQPAQPLTAIISNEVNANCSTGAQLTIAASGGTGPYEYAAGAPGFVPVAGDFGSSNVLNLDYAIRTNWDIVVKDFSNICTFRINKTIIKDDDPTIIAPALQCYTGSPLSITIPPTWTVDPDFTPAEIAATLFSIGGAFQVSTTFTVNAPGTYPLTIKDKNGCFTTVNYAVNPQLLLNAVLTKEMDCLTAQPNATITLTAIGGVGPFTYEASTDGGVTYAAPGVGFVANVYTAGVGTYTFRVTDSQLPLPSCQAISNDVIVAPTITPTFSFTQTPETCDTSNNGTITVKPTAGVAPFQYIIDAGIPQVSNVFVNLPARVAPYQIQIVDSKGCPSVAVPVTIVEPLPVAGTATVTTPLSCGAGNTVQTATITAVGTVGTGSGAFEYSFNGGINYSATPTFNTNTAGLITVWIRDANGCTVSIPVTVIALDPPRDLAFGVTPILCAPAANTTSTVTVTIPGGFGGVLPLSFKNITTGISNGTGIFPGLSTGTYLFEVKDANSCTYQESVFVADKVNITVAGQLISDVTCNGLSTGAVTFTVSNFGGAYTYVLTPVAGAVTVTNGVGFDLINVTGLTAGSYKIDVTETATGCTATATINVAEPPALSLVPATNINANCNFDAQVSVTASGGTAPYQYVFVKTGDPIPVFPAGYSLSNSAVLNPVTSLTWDVFVTDAKGCSTSVPITIIKDADPTITAPAPPFQCYVGLPLTIDLKLFLSEDPLFSVADKALTTYSIGGAYQLISIFTLNAPGIYNLFIKDKNGCIATTTYEVKPQLQLNAVLTKDLDCTALPDATITLTASGGTAPYTVYEYSTTGGAPFTAMVSNVLSTLTAGTYTFRVTDTQGCQAISNVVIVTPQTTPTLTFTQTNVSCNGGSDGSIVVTATNGIAPYQYSIDNGVTFPLPNSNVFTGLTNAGVYTVVVKDSKGCPSAGTPVTITEPAIVGISILPGFTNLTCGAGASFTVAGSGGTGSYLYSFDGGVNYSSNPTYTTNTSGSVTAYVKDTNNCGIGTTVIHPIPALDPPTDLDFAPTAVTCVALTSTVTVTIPPLKGGVLPLSFRNVTTGVVDPGGVFAGLLPGTYLFEVTDANNCTYQESYTVLPVVNITVAGQLISDVTCNGSTDGKIRFIVSNNSGAFTSALIAGAGVITTTGNVLDIVNLGVGLYTIRITDTVTGCFADATVTVNQPVALTLALSATGNKNANCNFDAQVAVTAGGGTPGYLYSFVPAVPGTAGAYSASNSAVLNPATTLNWVVWVQDANLCTTSISVSITTDAAPTVAAPGLQCYIGAPLTIVVGGTTFDALATATYSIGGAYQASNTFNGITPGLYNLSIKDGNNCIATTTYEVKPQLFLNALLTQDLTCVANANIVLTATGGTGTYSTYEYSADGGTTYTLMAGNVLLTPTAGTYQFRVTDNQAPACPAVSNAINVTPNTTPTLSFTQTNVNCNGGNDGTITVTGLTGIAPYTYSIDNGATFQTSNLFIGLVAGNYNLVVKDSKGCNSAPPTLVTITQLSVVTIDPVLTTATAFTCASNKTSTITITATGGTTIYTYSIDGINYSPSNTFSVIDKQDGVDYVLTVYVKDSNGCPATGTVNIDSLLPLTAVVNQNALITCTNPEDITITANGGSGNYSYQLLPIGIPNPNVIQDAIQNVFHISAPGDYYFQVNDLTTGCTFATAKYTVAPFNLINVTATPSATVTCFGDTNGTAIINITGYTGTYDYQVLDSSGNPYLGLVTGNTTPTPLTITGLTGGSYTLRVTETATPFCTFTTNAFVIASPATALAVTAVKTADATCTDDQGTITATGVGGWGALEYELVGTVNVGYSSNPTFGNLRAGNYTVNVRDSKGCISPSAAVLLDFPLPILLTATANVPSVNCNGDTNAIVTAVVNAPLGGKGSDYSYSLNALSNGVLAISGPQASPIFGGLGAGSYTVTVDDEWNCTQTSAQITIGEPAPVTASLVLKSRQTCLTDPVITLSVIPGTGTPPYSYVDALGATIVFAPSADINIPRVSLPITNNYVVTDANGCKSFVTNDILIEPLEPLSIILDLTNAFINCKGDASGVVVAKAQGGLGNYTYTLLDGAGNPLQVVVQEGQVVFTNLATGFYQVAVDSDVDCQFTSNQFEIKEPLVALTQSNVITNVLCNGNNDGQIVVTGQGGTGVIQYAISPDLNKFLNDGTFRNLGPGSYQYIVQDQAGCFQLIPFDIIEPNPLTAVPTIIAQELCFNDKNAAFDVVVTGGTEPFSTSLDDENGVYTTWPVGQSPISYTGLTGGVHTVYIRDFNNCEFKLVVPLDPSIFLDPQFNRVYACVGNVAGNTVTVTIDGSNVLADVTYSLDNSTTTQTSNVFPDLVPGDHFIIAHHKNGCVDATPVFNILQIDPLATSLSQGPGLNEIVATTTGGSGIYQYTLNDESYGSQNKFIYYRTGDYKVVVTDSYGCTATDTQPFEFIDIEIPNVFTPNGSGTNDTWKPEKTDNYPDMALHVYDRYGREVGTLSQGESWDGNYNGTELPMGDYWYVLKLRNTKDDREFVGHFTLYR
jgi:gliding motility-associated-like protein